MNMNNIQDEQSIWIVEKLNFEKIEKQYQQIAQVSVHYTEKTIIPFPFTVNGIWSWWQFLKQMEIPFGSKTVTTIISHSLWKEMEI